MKKISILFCLFFYWFCPAQCWESLAVGDITAAGIKSDGSLWIWGYYASENNYAPIRVGTENDWKKISVGLGFQIALKNDGTLWAWGNTYAGAVGNGVNTPGMVWAPIQIGTDTDWLDINCDSAYYTLALKTDGSLWCWGDNHAGCLGLGPGILDVAVPTRVGLDNDWIFACASGGSSNFIRGSSFAIKSDGTLWSWGFNSSGQLGDGTTINKDIPTPVPNTTGNWKKAVSQMGHSFFLKTDGTLWACGYNQDGILGIGSDLNAANLNILQVGTDTDWKDINTGLSHATALKTDGTLWCWGLNTKGQLGLGAAGNHNTPVQAGDFNAAYAAVSCGLFCTLVLDDNGEIGSTGQNNYGVLGITSTQYITYSLLPVNCPSLETQAFTAENISLYPNPVTDFLNIDPETALKMKQITVKDLSGRTVLNTSKNFSPQIDLRHLSKGIFLVEIDTDKGVVVEKIIKQ